MTHPKTKELTEHACNLIDALYNDGRYAKGRPEKFLPGIPEQEVSVIKYLAIATGLVSPIIRPDIDDMPGDMAKDWGEIQLNAIGVIRMREYGSSRKYRNSFRQLPKRLVVFIFARIGFFTLRALEKGQKSLVSLNTLVTIFATMVTAVLLLLQYQQDNTVEKALQINTSLQARIDSLSHILLLDTQEQIVPLKQIEPLKGGTPNQN